MKLIWIAAFSVLSLAGCQKASACSAPTDQKQWSIRAQDALGKVDSWDSLHDYYKAYVQNICQSGGIEDSYVDAVAIRFTRHWPELDRYAALSTNDSGFKAFVMAKLATPLYGLDDARTTYKLARDQCPAAFNQQCSEIMQALLTAYPITIKDN